MDEIELFMDKKNLPSILLENKADLLPPNEVNNVDSLKSFAKSNNFTESFRTSAKTGLNVNESMDFLIKNIIKRLSKINGEINPDANSISLDPEKNAINENLRQRPKSGCC